MNNLVNFGLLILGFVMLIKGADFFVDGAAGIAKKFRIPELVVGLTIVAMGTSAPEAAVSIAAALKGNGDITLGNVLGSNILNVLIILGITSLIVPIAIGESTVKIELPFMVMMTVVLMTMGLHGGEINRFDGVILWMFFLLYMGYLLYSARGSMVAEAHKKKEKQKPVWLLLLMTAAGMALIIFGSNMAVNAATEIATWLGVSSRVIALTVVAFGTSLPELVTSVTASKKGNADIAIGNIVGSNIFNILFVTGTTALITDVTFAEKFLFDMGAALLASLLLMFFAIKDRALKRYAGGIMVAVYAVYLAMVLLA